jgi:hypothetical protein
MDQRYLTYLLPKFEYMQKKKVYLRKQQIYKIIQLALSIKSSKITSSNYCCASLLLGGAFCVLFFVEFGHPDDFENFL